MPAQPLPHHLMTLVPCLHQLGLDQQSTAKLIASGVDDLETIALVEEHDLRRIDLNIGNALRLTHYSAQPACVPSRDPESTAQMLTALRLEMFQARFVEEGIDSLAIAGLLEQRHFDELNLRVGHVARLRSFLICSRCMASKVRYDCGHLQCNTLQCCPSWWQDFEAARWLVPDSPNRMLDARLFEPSDRCSACRPESKCLNPLADVSEKPKFCTNIFRRGRCQYGAKCRFCHLHGVGCACRNA